MKSEKKLDLQKNFGGCYYKKTSEVVKCGSDIWSFEYSRAYIFTKTGKVVWYTLYGSG